MDSITELNTSECYYFPKEEQEAFKLWVDDVKKGTNQSDHGDNSFLSFQLKKAVNTLKQSNISENGMKFFFRQLTDKLTNQLVFLFMTSNIEQSK